MTEDERLTPDAALREAAEYARQVLQDVWDAWYAGPPVHLRPAVICHALELLAPALDGEPWNLQEHTGQPPEPAA